MEGMRDDEVRGGSSVETEGKSKVCEVSAKCRLAIPHMPRGIKSNIETLVTGTRAGSPWSGGVGV